jgi:hypothetical protein
MQAGKHQQAMPERKRPVKQEHRRSFVQKSTSANTGSLYHTRVFEIYSREGVIGMYGYSGISRKEYL